MKASVAVGLGLGNVILLFNQLDVVLTDERLGDAVNVVHIGAYHADAGDVIEMRLNALAADLPSLALQFFDDAEPAFQARLNRADGIALVFQLEFGVQYLQLRAYLAYCGGIVEHQLLEVEHGVKYLIGVLHDGLLYRFVPAEYVQRAAVFIHNI